MNSELLNTINHTLTMYNTNELLYFTFKVYMVA